jgi:hypothetical protein
MAGLYASLDEKSTTHTLRRFARHRALAPLRAASCADTLDVHGVLMPVQTDREAVEDKLWRHTKSTSIAPLS